MALNGAHVAIETPLPVADLEQVLSALSLGTPFRLESIERIGPDVHRCEFGLSRPGIVVGFGNVIDLQFRIAREFDIVSVERRPALSTPV